MSLCNTDCNNLIKCTRCSRQLCKPLVPGGDIIVQEQCTTIGFYKLAEGKVCSECYSKGANKHNSSMSFSKQTPT